jgi:hypothetical protein
MAAPGVWGRMTQARKSEVLQQRWQSLGDEWNAPVFGFLAVLLTGAAAVFFVIFSLCRPAVYPNPTATAYAVPAATRLVPLPRQSTAPALADLPVVDLPSPLTAFAKAKPDEPPVKSEKLPPARKHPRADASAFGQPAYGFAQPWNFQPQGPSNNHVRSGGPKSPL